MKKAIMFLFIVFLLTSMPDKVFAEETGIIKINIDVNTNAPEGLENYDFYVDLMNETTNESESYSILYLDNYYEEIIVPYGTYYVLSAGVVNDTLGKFDLKLGDSFTVSKEFPTVDITLGFSNFNVIENKQEQPATEPIQIESEEPVITLIPQQSETSEKQGNMLFIPVIVIVILGVGIIAFVALNSLKKTKN